MTEVKFYLCCSLFHFQRQAVAKVEKNVLNDAEFELGFPGWGGGAWSTQLYPLKVFYSSYIFEY